MLWHLDQTDTSWATAVNTQKSVLRLLRTYRHLQFVPWKKETAGFKPGAEALAGITQVKKASVLLIDSNLDNSALKYSLSLCTEDFQWFLQLYVPGARLKLAERGMRSLRPTVRLELKIKWNKNLLARAAPLGTSAHKPTPALLAVAKQGAHRSRLLLDQSRNTGINCVFWWRNSPSFSHKTCSTARKFQKLLKSYFRVRRDKQAGYLSFLSELCSQ